MSPHVKQLLKLRLCWTLGAKEGDLRKGNRSFLICQRVLILFLFGFSTGCITDATTDLTKAPFDAITELTDGTTDATTALTEPTREFISSTTPGAWFHSDGTLNPKYEKIAFVVLNFDSLQEDMAHGGGEYLMSLSKLIGISPDSREAFFKSAQSRYSHIFGGGHSRPEALKRLIQTFPSLSVSSS